MLKIYCDVCKQEVLDTDFVFEAKSAEVKDDLTGGSPVAQKQVEKKMIQICKECFDKHLRELLK